jgi:hypothetical protein
MPSDYENMTNQSIDKNLVDLIAKNWGTFCSSCGAQKDLAKLRTFKKVGPATQILSECEKCGMKTLITAFPNLGMHINQIRNDLNSEEFERFSAPITSNDYLDFYNEIKNVTHSDKLMQLLNKIK